MPRARDQFARSVLDALDSGLAILDRDRRVLAWNEWLASASGIPAAETSGKSIEELFPAVATDRLAAAVKAALEQGASSVLSHALHPTLLPLKTRAGRELIHNVAVRPVGDRPYLGCLIQVADVTLAVERERVLRQRQNARYDAVVSSAPDPILTMDAEGVIRQANPAAEVEFGYPLDKLIGVPLAHFIHNQAQQWEGAWAAVLRGLHVDWPLELVVERKDGSLSYVDASASRWLSDSRVFVTSILRNVNARRAAEAELRRLNETLEERVVERTLDLQRAHEQLRQSQKMDAIGQLTGGVAHDFNNLLTPILGGLDMLQRRGTLDERSQRLVDGALQSAERARVLVQRLLAFARRQPLSARAVDLRQLVEGMTDLVSSTLGPRIRIVMDVRNNLPAVLADPNQLELALLNLAVNARDAMEDGGTLTISAGEAEAEANLRLEGGRYVRLGMTDTGVGMDADTLSRAVEPFFSTKGVGKGTGLGLSMIHGLAAQLGGMLDIASTPGVGTRVDIWLPIAHKDREAATALPAEQGAVAGAGVVLLVDDEEMVRASTAEMLSDLGYTVIEAASGKEALARLDDESITLLVTDHLMPGMTGAELARETQARSPDRAILIISGYAELDHLAPDLPRLMKPFRQEELSAALRTLADAHR
jgi:PAS domain S-box-containing protein